MSLTPLLVLAYVSPEKTSRAIGDRQFIDLLSTFSLYSEAGSLSPRHCLLGLSGLLLFPLSLPKLTEMLFLRRGSLLHHKPVRVCAV